ncbi:hypothetical protein EON66_05665 [archaeon]|nr:MAG: hypothetical protein EON66_05665 [archaeon]
MAAWKRHSTSRPACPHCHVVRAARLTHLPACSHLHSGFNARLRCGVLACSVYGGPHVQLVQNVERLLKGGHAYARALRQAGMLVAIFDGRGSARRGTAFEQHLFHRFGTVEVADQLAGVQWLVACGLTDPERLGVHGWSYGGYMTLRLLSTPGSPFVAGVAGAPVVDWTLYDTCYTERCVLRSLPRTAMCTCLLVACQTRVRTSLDAACTVGAGTWACWRKPRRSTMPPA